MHCVKSSQKFFFQISWNIIGNRCDVLPLCHRRTIEETDLLMNVCKTFDYLTEQLPHATNVMTEASVDIVS